MVPLSSDLSGELHKKGNGRTAFIRLISKMGLLENDFFMILKGNSFLIWGRGGGGVG